MKLFSFSPLVIWTYEADKLICSSGIRMNVAVLVFPHSPSLRVSTAHSTIRLTSALHISSILPVPTLIPTLPQIQHNQCFIWPWLNPFSFHLLERVEWLFSVELTPSTFPVRAETFPQAVCSSARRVLAWRESLQAKQGLSFYLLNSEWTLWKWNPSESVLTACHLRQH